MQDTSRIAYKEINEDGTLDTQRKVILSAIKDYCNRSSNLFTGISLREIKLLTGYDINAVSGRVNGLKKDNLVTTIDKRRCSISKRLISPVVPKYEEKDTMINDLEGKVELLLKMRGYKDIKFVQSLDRSRALRIGYYNRITEEDIEYCLAHGSVIISEINVWDDDCGNKYWYLMKRDGE